MLNIEDELNDLLAKLNRTIALNCPSFLTPCGYFVGISPGNNLDVLQISFDFRIDRTTVLKSETPDYLKDPSKPDLKILPSGYPNE